MAHGENAKHNMGRETWKRRPLANCTPAAVKTECRRIERRRAKQKLRKGEIPEGFDRSMNTGCQ